MKIAVVICLAVGLAYCGYLAMLYVGQDGMVFPGRPVDSAKIEQIKKYYKNLEEFTVKTADGPVLRGYWLPRLKDGAPMPVVLYFHGNAEEQTGFFLWSPNELFPLGVAGVDYRGYGRSEGKPTEAAIKADALAVYDALAAKLGPNPRIVVMGRSLGTAVAAHVAANRPVAGVILVTPFASLADVGQESHPMVPVRLLMKYPFDVRSDAARVTAPTLMLVAGDDTLTPPRHAHLLAAAWKTSPDLRTIDGTTHGNIVDSLAYWTAIRDFLKGVLGVEIGQPQPRTMPPVPAPAGGEPATATPAS